MGNIPHGFQIGDACHTCVGVIFEELRTPAYIAVQFAGIERLFDWLPPAPNAHRFILRETAFCYWFLDAKFEDQHYQVWVYLDDGQEKTIIKGKFFPFPQMYFFEFIDPPACQIKGDSSLPNLGDVERNGYRGGSGEIFWGSAINETAFWEQDIVGVP